VRWGDADVTAPAGVGVSEQPTNLSAPVPDHQHGANQRADHRVAKCVGPDFQHRKFMSISVPMQVEQGPSRRRAGTLATESREVPQPDQLRCSLVHRIEIQWGPMSNDLMTTQGIDPMAIIGDAVTVAPRQRREPGIEARVSSLGPTHNDISACQSI